MADAKVCKVNENQEKSFWALKSHYETVLGTELRIGFSISSLIFDLNLSNIKTRAKNNYQKTFRS